MNWNTISGCTDGDYCRPFTLFQFTQSPKTTFFFANQLPNYTSIYFERIVSLVSFCLSSTIASSIGLGILRRVFPAYAAALAPMVHWPTQPPSHQQFSRYLDSATALSRDTCLDLLLKHRPIIKWSSGSKFLLFRSYTNNSLYFHYYYHKMYFLIHSNWLLSRASPIIFSLLQTS